ncbi:formyltransferase family protein [Acinetobacter sp.]|uniref:formyltransferase family protein n=1 Tax=Acinetobacter sp. TaxID=472 RepID=UPI000C527770|nr:formyltransferase family protein [Acinetobacter sp.]MBC69477.1 methionyl-tRNA formyltransferase [Acinetobacter sp.]
MKDKLVLFLASERGFEVLKSIHKKYPSIIEAVYTAEDANVEKDFASEIRYYCAQNKVKCELYNKDEAVVEKDSYIMAISWKNLINHPPEKLIILHDSLLPKYRGFSPLCNMLIKAERKIGVTAIFGEKEYDKGDIISQSSCNINYPIKIHAAIQKNIQNYIKCALEISELIFKCSKITASPQDDSIASYSVWRNDDDYKIDWQQPSSSIKRFIDAVGWPYRGARTSTSKGIDIIIDDAVEVPGKECELRHVGKVIYKDDDCPVVICGEGLLKIKKARFVSTDKSFLPLNALRTKFY